MNIWPIDTPDQQQLFEFFGEPGDNQVRFKSPFPLKLSWNEKQTIKGFSCNDKVHDSLGIIYEEIYELYGEKEIDRLRLNIWGGCLSIRQKRNGNNFSIHAFGGAIDTDPNRNKLMSDHTEASLSDSIYEPFWAAFEKEGWVSLGRTRDNDWMHAQAARIG